MELEPDDFNEFSRANVYDDDTVVRVTTRRTEDSTYPSGWRYTLHYGALSANTDTLADGTIRRYDNSHESTKGHECHAAPDPEPQCIEFPGIVELYERFWREVPKQRFGPAAETGETR